MFDDDAALGTRSDGANSAEEGTFLLGCRNITQFHQMVNVVRICLALTISLSFALLTWLGAFF